MVDHHLRCNNLQYHHNILPSYEMSTKEPRSVAHYEAVRQALDDTAVSVIDGVALFEQQPDALGLFTLRADNHPSERGHALIASAVIAAVENKELK